MAHMYDKAPPKFAKDPWAWDYTRDRIEGNTGIPYDQWEGKHFAGSAAMYKNVIKKYGASIENGVMTAPHECVDCGDTKQHYQDDYVCKDCRDAIEAADSYEEAAATINQPEAIDAIREQLYKSLGHDKKDAKAGRIVGIGQTPEFPSVAAGEPVYESDLAPTNGATVSRNYNAMGDDKLKRSIKELEAGSGEAVQRAEAKGEDINSHLEAALRAAQEKGLWGAL